MSSTTGDSELTAGQLIGEAQSANRVLVSRDDLEVKLGDFHVDADGCTLRLLAEGRSSGMDGPSWREFVACVMHGFVSPEGRAPDTALQVAAALAEDADEKASDPHDAAAESTYAPSVQGFFVSGLALKDIVEAEHRARISPVPPRWPIAITISWPNVDVAPVTLLLANPSQLPEPVNDSPLAG